MLFPFEETLVRAVFDVVNRAAFLKSTAVFLGSISPWILATWFLISLLGIKSFKLRFYYGSLAVIGILISRGIITEALRNLIYIPRPFEFFDVGPVISHAVTTGMPSGHMAFLVPIAVVFILMKRKDGMVAAAGVLLVGIARIAAGVHWISDVVIGIAAGIAGFYLAKALLPKRLSDNPHIDEVTQEEID
jgi:membrane-associated phospholipid phosphatase